MLYQLSYRKAVSLYQEISDIPILKYVQVNVFGSLNTFIMTVLVDLYRLTGAAMLVVVKHWTGVVRFISPLWVNFKLSNSRQQKYGVIVRKTVLCNKGRMNLWINLWKVTKLCCYVSACFFKWVYANPWHSFVGIRRIPAYHVEYTTIDK